MARMEIEDIDLGEVLDIQNRRKVRMAEIANSSKSTVREDESPFSEENMKGATKKRVRMSRTDRKDIQNIGSGTRCLSCGALHFCWTPKCGVCGDPMTYNLGSHSSRRGR
jgi:hypothetical protein